MGGRVGWWVGGLGGDSTTEGGPTRRDWRGGRPIGRTAIHGGAGRDYSFTNPWTKIAFWPSTLESVPLTFTT